MAKLVRFIKNSLPYNGGDQATFEDEQAARLIAQQYAVEIDADGNELPCVAEPAAVAAGAVSSDVIQPATLEELTAEVKASGYEDEAAASIAAKRLAGEFGEVGKYLKGTAPIEALRADLDGLKKAEIVKAALENYQLELDEGKKKDELIEAYIAAHQKQATAPPVTEGAAG
jgi:Xaa-Pro aminopeptidase